MSETSSTAITQFSPESVDKTSRILEYLDVFKTHPHTKGKVCLHGGTALNLFALEPDRLSLDADINYLGNESAENIKIDRTKLEKAVVDVARELGYAPTVGKDGHAGRTFKLLYRSPITDGNDFLKVDLNFMNRVPLLKPLMATSTTDVLNASFPINAPVEIVAGKLKAICERVVPRDLFDIGRIARSKESWTSGNDKKDHAIMMFYFSLSASFPKQMDVLSRFDGREKDVETILWPVLPTGNHPSLLELKIAASDFITLATQPQYDTEKQYLEMLAQGEYRPDILFADDPDLAQRADASPAMAWKLVNLRKGIEEGLVHPLH